MKAAQCVAFVVCLLSSGVGQAERGDNSVGMNAHNAEPAVVDAAADLGVRWIRVDGNWFQFEPNRRGQYNWQFMDDAVARANAAGLSVFMTLAYTPGWVARHGDTDGNPGNDVPNDAQDWADFVRAAVTHFRAAGVRHFGLWNEANLDGFWEGTLQEYVDVIVIPGATAIREVCGDCVVLGPDLANVGDADVALRTVMERGGQHFDIVTHHIYQDFAETGWNIFAGDSFMNVLDMQRVPGFTRVPIRTILDDVGYTGEVWITETGYRADPGDSGEENKQSIYVRRVLEEQLARDWYTNTFFYETIDCKPDLPDCTIDGYGLMRADRTGARSFPQHFRLKPAYQTLKQFIADHPQIIDEGPAPQCGDGVDNDGDGRIDGGDRGCSGALDDDESDDPPRRRLDAMPAGAITIDGDLGEYGNDGWVWLSPQDWQGQVALSSPTDLLVRATARWRADRLYLALEVTDDTHHQPETPDRLWLADSLQADFDIRGDGGSGLDSADDHEVNFGLANGSVTVYRFHGPANATDAIEAAIVRSGNRTLYEIAWSESALAPANFGPGAVFGFSFIVNDHDAQPAGREGWMEWTPGIGVSKEPELWGELRLVEGTEPPEDTGTMDAGNDVADDVAQDVPVADADDDPFLPDASPDAPDNNGAGNNGVSNNGVSNNGAGNNGAGNNGNNGVNNDGIPFDGDLNPSEPGEEDEGCGCGVPGGRGVAPGALWLCLGVVAALAWRLRRS